MLLPRLAGQTSVKVLWQPPLVLPVGALIAVAAASTVAAAPLSEKQNKVKQMFFFVFFFVIFLFRFAAFVLWPFLGSFFFPVFVFVFFPQFLCHITLCKTFCFGADAEEKNTVSKVLHNAVMWQVESRVCRWQGKRENKLKIFG